MILLHGIKSLNWDKNQGRQDQHQSSTFHGRHYPHIILESMWTLKLSRHRIGTLATGNWAVLFTFSWQVSLKLQLFKNNRHVKHLVFCAYNNAIGVFFFFLKKRSSKCLSLPKWTYLSVWNLFESVLWYCCKRWTHLNAWKLYEVFYVIHRDNSSDIKCCR